MNFRYFYIPLFFFLISCDFNEDAIPITDINQDELKYQKFELDTTKSILYDHDSQIGMSHLIYSGFLNDSSQVYSLFKIEKEIFNNYELCADDSIKYNSIYMVVDLVDDYHLGEINSNTDFTDNNFGEELLHEDLLAYWINLTEINLDQNFDINNWSESDHISFNNLSLDLVEDLDINSRLFLEKYQGKHYINLTEKLISPIQDSIFNNLDLCNPYEDNDKFLLIKTNPSTKILYEFASSNYISDYSNTEPYLNIVYNKYEKTTNSSNRIMLSDDQNYQDNPNILFVSDSLSNNFNNLFISNSFIQNGDNQINDSLIWSDYNFNSSINLNPDSTINLTFKVSLQNFQDSVITIWLDKIKYIEFVTDPNEDNWSESFPDGTEGNNLWDFGEYLEDFGLDLCKDTYENGEGCEVDSTFSTYNNLGTENNNIWDEGEFYYDYGLDMCPDSYEDEAGGCICNYPDSCSDVMTLCDDSDNDGLCDNGTDPNFDNYNIDPSNDDWFDCGSDTLCPNDLDYLNPDEDGTELNGQWDAGEGTEGNYEYDFGEIYLDIGNDGLDSQLIGYEDEDGTELNGQWDAGEPFFDTGIDNLNTQNEPGWNIVGLQNNISYQFGEIFNDCGIDADCYDNNIIDDYNIDPNSDNWLDCGSDMLCPNHLDYLNPDEDGTELNGQWDTGEGTESNNLFDNEYFEDFGIDQLSDNDEQLYYTQKINISTSDTVFFDTENQELNYVTSNSNNNDLVKIEIEDVELLDSINIMINVKISSEISILGVELRVNHAIYRNEVYDWVRKERNVAKIDSDSYISDISIYNDIITDTSKLYFNSGYGISSLLQFNGLTTFLNRQDIVINESNSLLKLYLDNSSSDVILKSNQYILNFNEINDENIEKNLFSYYVQNNPDSLVIPLGNLIQKYINDEANFSNGLLIGLETNQYPPIFNFNNIILDSSKPPVLEVYYFE